MKAFWADLFHDMKEADNFTEEKAADFAGKYIRDDIDIIEAAIKDYDLKKALALIWEMKKTY
jgi:hypothetical protein